MGDGGTSAGCAGCKSNDMHHLFCEYFLLLDTGMIRYGCWVDNGWRILKQWHNNPSLKSPRLLTKCQVCTRSFRGRHNRVSLDSYEKNWEEDMRRLDYIIHRFCPFQKLIQHDIDTCGLWTRTHVAPILGMGIISIFGGEPDVKKYKSKNVQCFERGEKKGRWTGCIWRKFRYQHGKYQQSEDSHVSMQRQKNDKIKNTLISSDTHY